MNTKLEEKGQEVWVTVTGPADSLQGKPAAMEVDFQRLEDMVRRERPAGVALDFRGLTFADSVALQEIATQVARLRRLLPVRLVGPGPGLDRLFQLVPPPPDWSWSDPEPRPDADGEESGVRRRAAPSSREVFEIDLNREVLLRESEPPEPDFNPMAQPLDLRGGPAARASSVPAAPEPMEAEAGIEEGIDDAPEAAGELKWLDESPEKQRPQASKDLWWEEEGEAWTEVPAPSPERRPAPPAPPAITAPGEAGPRTRREEMLEARLVAASLLEGELRARVTHAESEALWLRAQLEAALASPRPAAAAAGSSTREASAGPDAGPGAGPRAGSDQRAGGAGARSSDAERVPYFLRGDAPRAGLVRELGRLIDARRRGADIRRAAVLDLAVNLAGAVERAPFASFDFGQTRGEAPAEALAIYSLATALWALVWRGEGTARLERLAVTGLLWVLSEAARLGPAGLPVRREAGGPAGGRLLRQVSELLSSGGRAASGEEESRESLALIDLAGGVWERVARREGGGTEPAAAMAALGRGEIAPEAPQHLRRLLLDALSAFPPGSWVRLASGEVGIVVSPGTSGPRAPLVLSLLAGGEKELRFRPPRLVDTGREPDAGVRAVVACPIRPCPAPREILRAPAGAGSRRSAQPETGG